MAFKIFVNLFFIKKVNMDKEKSYFLNDITALLAGGCLAGLLLWVALKTGFLSYILSNLP